MTKTNFDVYLEKQLSDPDFAERYRHAREAWEAAVLHAQVEVRLRTDPPKPTSRKARI